MKHLVLIGLMGSGKTTVGQVCAEKLGRDFVDTDDVVVALAQMPVPDIFASSGETGFRQYEKQAVADVSASTNPLVIACGGGAAVDPENRRALKRTGIVIWLQAPVAVLAARVGDDAGRPLLAGDPARALSRLEAVRAAAYDATADVAVDAAGTVDDVARAVIDAFEAQS